MKRFKKVISIGLAVIMVINFMTITTYASDEVTSFDDYAHEVAERFLNITGFEYGNDYQISNSFDVYNFDDESYVQNRKLSFIMSDNKIIGVINTGDINGEYISSYYEISSEELNNAFNDSSDIVVGYKKEIFYILTNNKIIYMSNDKNNDILISDFDFTNISFDTIIIENEYVYSPVTTRATILFNKQLNVKRVNNGNSPRTGVGLCWAATSAMKINFQKSKSLTAMNIYNAMYNKYKSEPVGNMIWHKRVYPYYGVSCKYYDRGLGAGDVSNAIRDNKPVHIDVFPSKGIGHSVIISGVTICDNYATYTITDPNEPVKIYQDISYQAMSDPKYFVYYAKENTYIDWRASVI